MFYRRYDREIDKGVRPPLRLIASHDASAAAPMVLLVCGGFVYPDLRRPDGGKVIGLAELELTDGWYRMRAKTDVALTRAVRAGKIKVGLKIAVVGAKESITFFHKKHVLTSTSAGIIEQRARRNTRRREILATCHLR